MSTLPWPETCASFRLSSKNSAINHIIPQSRKIRTPYTASLTVLGIVRRSTTQLSTQLDLELEVKV